MQAGGKNPLALGWNSSARRQDNPIANYSGANIGLMCGSPIHTDRIRGFVTVIDLDKKELSTPELLAKYEIEKTDFISKIGSYIPGATAIEKQDYLRWIEQTGGRGGLHIMLNFFLPFRHKKIKLEYETFTLAMHGITDKLRYENAVVWPSHVENYYTHIGLAGDPDSDEYIAKVDEVFNVFCSHRLDFVEYEAFYNFLFPNENYYERLRTVLFPFTMYSDDFCYDFYGKMLSGWCLRSGVTKEKYLYLLENTHFHKNGKNVTYENIIKLVDKTYRENKVDSYPGWSAIIKSLRDQGDKLFADSLYTNLMISAVDFYLNSYFGIIRDGEVPKISLQAAKRGKWDVYELNDSEIANEAVKYTQFVSQSADMINLATPKLDNLVEESELLTRGDVLMAFGPDATRKTFLFMDLCHSLSKGIPFWGGRFTPKKKCKILYFYADRNKAKHTGDYLPPFQSYDPEYLTYVYIKDLWRINKNFRFDISSAATWAYITKMVDDLKPDLIVFDSWHGCGPCSDFYDKNQMAEFMSYLIRFSNEHQLVTAIVHHSNKQNTKEMRNMILGKDDYQGAKCISSQMSYTFVINPVPNTRGKFSFSVAKEGMTDFPSFFYTLENYADEENVHKIRMIYEEFDQEKMAEEIMRTKYDVFKLKLIKYIENEKTSVELKSYFNVGKLISLSLWQKYLKQMMDDDLIVGCGSNYDRKYKLSPKGTQLINIVLPQEILLDITKIPIDVHTIIDQITDTTATTAMDTIPVSTPRSCVVTSDSSSVADILRAKQFSERAMAIEASIDLDRPKMLTIDTSRVTIKPIPDFAAEYEAKKIILDIESESANPEKFDVSKIYCIGLKTANETKIIENGDDEKTMLERFNDILKNIMMQEFWICGHNIISYDLRHIIIRMQVHGITCPLHLKRRMSGEICEWHHDFKNGIETYNIPECGLLQFIDTLFLVDYYDNQKAILSGHGLKVCAVELGYRDSPRLELTFSEILDCWKNNKPKLFEYLKYDLDDTDFLAKLLLPSYYYMEKYL